MKQILVTNSAFYFQQNEVCLRFKFEKSPSFQWWFYTTKQRTKVKVVLILLLVRSQKTNLGDSHDKMSVTSPVCSPSCPAGQSPHSETLGTGWRWSRSRSSTHSTLPPPPPHRRPFFMACSRNGQKVESQGLFIGFLAFHPCNLSFHFYSVQCQLSAFFPVTSSSNTFSAVQPSLNFVSLLLSYFRSHFQARRNQSPKN